MNNSNNNNRATEQTVRVGTSGYYSEFLMNNAVNAYIKSSFAQTKKHYNDIELAIQKHQTTTTTTSVPLYTMPLEQQQKQQRTQRTRITIRELLNPE